MSSLHPESIAFRLRTSLSLDKYPVNVGVVVSLLLVIALTWYSLRFSNKSNGVQLPTYILLEGYAIAQLLQSISWVHELVKLLRHGSSHLYGLSSKHRVVSSPSLVSSVLRRPHHTLNNDPAIWALQVRVFASKESMRSNLEAISEALFTAVSSNLLQETKARGIIKRTNDLLCSLVPSLVDSPAPWNSNARLKSTGQGGAEVNLYELIRDFTTFVSIRMLAGADFQAFNPDFGTDLFTLDKAFMILALGLPSWMPLKMMREAVSARGRMLKQLASFSARLEAVATDSADPDLQKRMADVSGIFWQRSDVYRSLGLSMDDRASLELALFWAMNGNTSPFVFWVVAFVYVDQELLAKVREELDPLIKVSETEGGKKIEDLDMEGIARRCPVFKAAYMETFRCAHEPTSLRYVQQDFNVTDPSHGNDAKPIYFQKGTFMTFPHTVQQFDRSIYPEPEEFRVDRFLKESEGVLKVDYGNLKPWGEGSGACKGRLFAEREVLMTAALIVRCWDIQAVDGVWKMPKKIPGTGVMKPSSSLRVRVTPRE